MLYFFIGSEEKRNSSFIDCSGNECWNVSHEEMDNIIVNIMFLKSAVAIWYEKKECSYLMNLRFKSLFFFFFFFVFSFQQRLLSSGPKTLDRRL